MKRTVLILAILALGLICLQQRSYADKKMSHAEYTRMELKECNACHKAEGVAPNHEADFMRNHKVMAGKAGKNCAECHDQAWCLDCHKGGGTGEDLARENFGRDYKPKSHRSDFVSIHPVKALDNPQQCYRCHDAKAFCASCHSRFPKGLRVKSHLKVGDSQSYLWKSDHAGEARRNLQSCQACHADGDVCLKCHSATSGARVNPHPRNFKGSNMRSRSDRTCRTCH